jgi:hypothetical protein
VFGFGRMAFVVAGWHLLSLEFPCAPW